MWSVCKKEVRQFFSSLVGYIVIVVFLLVNGLVLFVLEDNILDFGYASLDKYFQLAPWILLLLVPAITMNSFSGELKLGTYEILQTKPLSRGEIIAGKFFGNLLVSSLVLLPTLIYFFTVQSLSPGVGIDTGAAIGSYIGLFLLVATFIAIGICSSSFSSNVIISFIISILICVLFYFGFTAISKIDFLNHEIAYYIEMLGIDFHYQNISRGVLDTRDLIYFLSTMGIFFLITNHRLKNL